MMELLNTSAPNPIEHAKHIEEILRSLKTLCRTEVNVFQDQKAKALLETSAEVLGGLEKAFHDFLTRDIEAWKEEDEQTPQRSSDPWD
jgi:predicted metalloprotease with PDZ domain